MAYSTLASQADEPTAGPDHTYFEQIAANETALLAAVGARITSASAQTLTASTSTKLNLGTVAWDSLGGSFTGTSHRLTIPANWGGSYLVVGSANVEQSTSAAASARLVVRKNAATDLFEHYDAWSFGGSAIEVSLTAMFTVELAAADYLEVFYVNGESIDGTLREDLGLALSAVWLHA